MKALIALFLAVMLASTASAGLDPDPDSIGVYFDPAGNVNCVTVGPFQPITAYLVLMNPSGPVRGFECSVTMTGAPYFILSTTYNSGCGIDPDWDAPAGEYRCAGPSNFPVPANGALVLVTWSIMLQAPTEFLFYVRPSTVPSLPGSCPVVLGEDTLRCGGVASGDPDLPVAGINAVNCPVANEVNSFGMVKSLFR